MITELGMGMPRVIVCRQRHRRYLSHACRANAEFLTKFFQPARFSCNTRDPNSAQVWMVGRTAAGCRQHTTGRC